MKTTNSIFQLKEATLNGPSGLRVVCHVTEEQSVAFVRAPIPHQHTVAGIAEDWDELQNHGVVTYISVQVRALFWLSVLMELSGPKHDPVSVSWCTSVPSPLKGVEKDVYTDVSVCFMKLVRDKTKS